VGDEAQDSRGWAVVAGRQDAFAADGLPERAILFEPAEEVADIDYVHVGASGKLAAGGGVECVGRVLLGGAHGVVDRVHSGD